MIHKRLLFFENYVILRQTKTVSCLTIGLVYGNCRKNVIRERSNRKIDCIKIGFFQQGC